MSDGNTDAPAQNSDVVYPQTSAAMANPQFAEAYPLPPGRYTAAIPDTKQEAVTQALLKDKAYLKDNTQDQVSIKALTDSVKGNTGAVADYLSAVNRDVRGKVADEDWARYLKHQNKTADQLTNADDKAVTSNNDPNHVKTNYEKLQTIHGVTDKQNEADLKQARDNLIKLSDGKITDKQLDELQANRLAEAKEAQRVLRGEEKPAHRAPQGANDGAPPSLQIGTHPGHIYQGGHANGGHGGRGGETQSAADLNRQELQQLQGQGNAGELKPMGQWRGQGSDEAEELNHQENLRIQGHGQSHGGAHTEQTMQGAGQPPQGDWHTAIANWEQQNLGRVNGEQNDQKRYQEDVAWNNYYHNANGNRNYAPAGTETPVVPGAPAAVPGPGYSGAAAGGYYGGGYGAGGIGSLGLGVNIGFSGIGFGYGAHRPYYAPYNPGYYGGVGVNNGAYYNGANNGAYYNGVNNGAYYNGANTGISLSFGGNPYWGRYPQATYYRPPYVRPGISIGFGF